MWHPFSCLMSNLSLIPTLYSIGGIHHNLGKYHSDKPLQSWIYGKHHNDKFHRNHLRMLGQVQQYISDKRVGIKRKGRYIHLKDVDGLPCFLLAGPKRKWLIVKACQFTFILKVKIILRLQTDNNKSRNKPMIKGFHKENKQTNILLLEH